MSDSINDRQSGALSRYPICDVCRATATLLDCGCTLCERCGEGHEHEDDEDAD